MRICRWDPIFGTPQVEPGAKLAELADLRLDVGHRVDLGLDLREPLGDRRQLVHLGQLRLERLDLLEPGLDLVEPLRRKLPPAFVRSATCVRSSALSGFACAAV
jgi:hypothetical protein